MIRFILLFICSILISSCGSQDAKIKVETEQEGSLVKSTAVDSLLALRKKNIGAFYSGGNAVALVKSYLEYADNNSDQIKSADYRLAAARELCESLGAPKRALEQLKIIEDAFPIYKQMPVVLLYKGYVYENHLGEFGLAKSAYQQIIDEFPKDPIAKDAAGSIKNIGLTPDQIIEKYEKQNAN